MIKLAGAALALLMLIGCARPVEEITQGGGPSEQTTQRSDRVSERMFVSVIRQEYETVVSDEKLVELGYETCALVADMGAESAIDALTENGLPPEVAGYVIGAAVFNLCPENAEALR